MSMVAIIPVASMVSANDTLNNSAGTPGIKSFGPNNFSVPAYTGAAATHGALHSWSDAEFETAVKAIPGVVWEISNGDPVTRTQALITAQGAKWGAQAPQLPSTGNVTAGSLYRFDNLLWSVIQTFSRTTYNAHPSTYPALIRRIAEPGIICEWWQPLDANDAPKLVNPFTGKPDQRTHNGFTWKVTQADGSGNNVWEPGVYGWVDKSPVTEPVGYPAWKQPTGAQDAYKLNAKVSHKGFNWNNTGSDANVWEPGVYGWVKI